MTGETVIFLNYELNKALIFVEQRNKVPVGRVGFLEEAGEPEGEHMAADAGVFLCGDAAVEAGNGHAVAGNVLAHEADGDALGELVPDPGEEPEAFLGETGKDQVADQGAAQHDAQQRAEYVVPCSKQSQFPDLWPAALRCTH